jgi:hypothetical protein
MALEKGTVKALGLAILSFTGDGCLILTPDACRLAQPLAAHSALRSPWRAEALREGG